MTGPRQPRTCSHPINARMLTGVCQAIRMFSPRQFQVYICIFDKSKFHPYNLIIMLEV